jgi:hypothetical protein
MRKIAILVLLAGGWLAGEAQALELTNVHLTTGPFGSKRSENKFLPGDLLVVNFDIDSLKADPKDGMVAYQIRMEIFDNKDKRAFAQVVPPKRLLLLGGSRVPTYAVALLDPEQEAGRYKVKITVLDIEAAKSKAPDAEKVLNYEFQVLPKAFGIIQPVAAAAGFTGSDYGVSVGIVGFKRGKVKVGDLLIDKMPDVTMTAQVLDESGKPIFPKAVSFDVKVLWDPELNDLTKTEVVPVTFPLFLNRAGRFTIVIQAEDRLGKQKKEIRLPLRVYDSAAQTSG